MRVVEVQMGGCPERERVQEALDGRLPREEAAAVLGHARGGCPSCSPLVEDHLSLKAALSARKPGAPGACPPPELLSSFAAGPSRGPGRDAVVAHLADCRPCREDVIEVRALLREKSPTEHPRAALRLRLHALLPRKSRELAWIAAAAAAVFVAVLLFALPGNDEPAPVAVPPRPAPPRVAKEPPPPEPPRPVPAPEPERPVPAPPVPEPPSPVKPAPEPTKPPPAPPAPDVKPPAPPDVKPPPKTEPTREKPRVAGRVLAVAGSLSTRVEGDAAWQASRAAQSREFAGAIEVRAELNPAKFRLGPHTVYLQRRSEIAVALEEGVTRVRLAKGEALFDAAPGALSVQTANASVAVTGTRFLVAADADGTEVVVQRGDVELAAAEKTVKLSAAERSVAPAGKAPGAPAKADVARRLQWTRALEETLAIEAELMALQKGLTVLPDPAASGGRAIGTKGPLPTGTEATADARVQVKQPSPYAVWVRLLWNHGVAPSFSLQVHDQPKWDGRHVTAKPGWQWVRAGSYDLPAEAFRLRLADPQGAVRVDRFVVTSDPEYVPE